jgi:hypothetical protein
VPEEQIFAAQSGAHTGAIAKPSTVRIASSATLAGRARTGIVWFTFSSLRQAVAFKLSTLHTVAFQTGKPFSPSMGGIVVFAEKPASHTFWQY